MNPVLDSELARAALHVFEREIGSEAAVAFAASVKLPVEEIDRGRAIFDAAMVEIARQRPHLFGPLLSGFGEYPEPGALAAVYVQRNIPEALGGYRGNDVENLEVDFNREALVRWTGCELFLAPIKIVVVRPQCELFLAYMNYWRSADGMVLFDHEALRSTIWLTERSIRHLRRHSQQAVIVDLIIHEQLHCVIAQLARPIEGVYNQPLVDAVEEGCVELLSYLASSADPCWRVESAQFASWCASGVYAQQRTVIIEVVGGCPSAAMAARAFALAQANVKGASDAATAHLLNRLSGRRLSAQQWLARVGSVGFTPQPERL